VNTETVARRPMPDCFNRAIAAAESSRPTIEPLIYVFSVEVEKAAP
jgi:hypothetical protein